MLSDEGKAGEWWKTTMGVISKKKATLHTFFVLFFAVFFLHYYNVKLSETS